MEDQNKDGVESEEFSEAFLCCVCLDLLYKPIVLSCGHISCFWCVHKSMNGVHVSHCPICRHPYYHFPTICQMLHFLLLKMYPVAYKRREIQILEEEKKIGFFSPQFDAHICGSHSSQELNHPGNPAHSSTTVSQSNLCSDPCSKRKGGPCANIEQSESVSLFQDNDNIIPLQNCNGNFEEIKSVVVEEKNLPQNNPNRNCKQVSIADVMCAACKQLLFRPAVLNCGHVYCETCIINLADETLRCQVCQTLHPSGFPKVYLELDHFLEEQFPKEYALRRDAVQLNQVHFHHESSTDYSTKVGKQGVCLPSVPIGENTPWWRDNGLKFHWRVGCDSCGLFPIIGDRYKCKDCVEEIGFDLCGDCYNTSSKLPGRFNQQHTPEHKLELVESNILRDYVLMRLGRGQFDADSAASVLFTDTSENPENGSPTDTSEHPENGSPLILSSNAQGSAENDSAASVPSNDTVGDQHDPQSTI